MSVKKKVPDPSDGGLFPTARFKALREMGGKMKVSKQGKRIQSAPADFGKNPSKRKGAKRGGAGGTLGVLSKSEQRRQRDIILGLVETYKRDGPDSFRKLKVLARSYGISQRNQVIWPCTPGAGLMLGGLGGAGCGAVSKSHR